jgi:2-C-methyl-D-erythritol 4-phosphate cytidylyltransferase
MSKNIAVILAGGSGERFGSDIPKQFINLAGKEIIVYTLEVFEKHSKIDEICVVINSSYTDKINKIIDDYGFKKITKIISGGKERYESSYNAIKEYAKQKDINLIFHDAVRPFLSTAIINRTIDALDNYNAVDVAIASSDTIIEVEDEVICNIPKRSLLRRGQTPQAFKLETIKKAYENGIKSGLEVTDDCGVVLKYLPDEPICVVEGEERNIKITHKEDLLFAEKLLQLNTITSDKKPNIEDKVIVIFGSSSGIGKEIFDISKKHRAKSYGFSKRNQTDITQYEDIKLALKDVYKKEKRIDCIINCAGILEKKHLTKQSLESIENIIDVNLKGSLYIAKEGFEYLKKSKGMLLFFTSSSYTRGRENYVAYSATKAGVVNLTQALDEEFRKDKIRVNCINPSRTLTPMRTANFGDEPKETLLDPKEVAYRSLQVLSEDFSGQIIDIKKDI